MLLLYIIAAVYVAAVNLYAFLLVRTQKKRRDERGARTAAGDAKLLAAALLGGGAGVYAAMFITKFRTDSLLLMLLYPVPQRHTRARALRRARRLTAHAEK